MGDYIIPVVITVYADEAFHLSPRLRLRRSPVKKALNLTSGSGEPNKKKRLLITKAQLREIAEKKMPDLNATSVEAAMNTIAGIYRSMGVTVADD